MNAAPDGAAPRGPGLHGPCLAVALAVMLGGTLYPPLFAGPDGHADHRFAMALFWAMSAGFVRGVGFVPRARWARVLLSPWAMLVALGIAAALRLH